MGRAEELTKSRRVVALPLGNGKTLVYRVSDEIEKDLKIAMLNVESVDSDLETLDFANIFELRSDEHLKVLEILFADLGESLAESLWALRRRRVGEKDDDRVIPWFDHIIRILKRGGDHSHHAGWGKKIMGKVLKYPKIFGRQVSIEKHNKDIKLVVSKVDNEGKVVKTGVVASANKDQHEKVKSKLSTPIKEVLSPVIDNFWDESDKFSKGPLESDDWPMPKKGPTGWRKKWKNDWNPDKKPPKNQRIEA